MAKPTTLSITLGQQFDTIKTNIVNKLFEKLNELRTYHIQGGARGSGFSTTPATFNTNIAVDNQIIDTTYPTKIKEYITVLENSRYITNNYSNSIKIPVSTETLIKATEYMLEYINVINEIIAVNANDGAYNGANYGDYANYGNYGNYSNNSVCTPDYGVGYCTTEGTNPYC